MSYRRIPAHQAFASHFCSSCGVTEVANEGDKCQHCINFTALLEKKDDVRLGRGVDLSLGLKCKWPGCDETVKSHHGMAGWCGPKQKGHRQMEYERRRRESREEITLETQLPPLVVETVENGGWLARVAIPVRRAAEEVEAAEVNLVQAKERLRVELEKALEVIS